MRYFLKTFRKTQMHHMHKKCQSFNSNNQCQSVELYVMQRGKRMAAGGDGGWVYTV